MYAKKKSMLKAAEKNGNIQGIQVSHTSPAC